MVLKQISKELNEHIPFTLLATIIAIAFLFIYQSFFAREIPLQIFEIIHPLHIFVSAMATSAIFYRNKSKKIKAILIGTTGALILGTLSDVLFPYLGGILFQLQTEFHFPLIESPILILLSVLLGSLIGIKTKISKTPHFVHVFLSVFASLFYLITYSTIGNLIQIFLAGIIIFIAVIIPCCLSDIIYPLLFLESRVRHK